MLLHVTAAVLIVDLVARYAHASNNATVQCCASQVELVQLLRNKGYIKSDSVAEVMTLIDRKYYFSSDPYQFNETADNPAHMHAFALETLKDQLKPGNRILDIGCDNGYLTACMALMVGASGTTIGLESEKQIMELAKENIAQDPVLKARNITIKLFVEDSVLGGLEEFSPYDAIHVGLMSSELPESLLGQIKVMGRLLIPIPFGRYLEDMTVYDKDNEGDVTESRISGNFHAHRYIV